MKRRSLAIAGLLICMFSGTSQAQINNQAVMTNADYNTFLTRLEAALPQWESALNKIEPEKAPEVSYSMGKSIVNSRDYSLTNVTSIREFVAKQRAKRTVSGEFSIYVSLNSLFSGISSVGALQQVAGMNSYRIMNYLPEVASFYSSLGFDVSARVELLENGQCH
jgi:hypothetical protein